MIRKLPKIILIFLLVSTVLSVVGRIYFLSQLAVTGEDLRSAEARVYELTKENENLKKEIANYSSLSKIKETALALGMLAPTSLEFLTPPQSAALVSTTKSL